MASDNIIRALSDVEHVRLKPGMYVGQIAPQTKTSWVLDDSSGIPRLKWEEVTYSAALAKLFDEVISNSIDESYRLGHKSALGGQFTIWIKLEELPSGIWKFSVKDNGRGIPLKKAEDSEHLMVDLALCHLRAGSNFDAARAVSIGTHGLGVTLVNILSQEFIAEIDDGSQHFHLVCNQGIQKYRKLSFKDASPGTSISWIPDHDIFSFNADAYADAIKVIRRRIYDLAACFPQIQFKLDGIIVQSRSFKRYVNSFESSKLCSIGPDPLVFEYENLRLAILSSDENIHNSFVNGIETYEGGMHLEYVRNKIIDVVAQKLSKKHKVDIKPNDIRAKTCFVVMLDGVVDPQFRSQTKEFLSSAPGSFVHLLKDFDGEFVAKKLINSSHICDQIVEAFILKKEAKDRAEVKRLGKEMKKIRVAKLLPATSQNPSERILFLTEGDSAIGQLSTVRNPKIHGGYPLRGKVINCYGESIKEVFENKEIRGLAGALGITPGDNPEPSEIEYGRVVIMSDADYDGYSIKALLINIFMTLWPKLVEAGVLWEIQPPIYRWEKSGKIGFLYSQTEVAPEGAKLKYLKGLGSMDESDYSEMINNPRWSQVIPDEKAKESLILAFGPDADARKEWLA